MEMTTTREAACEPCRRSKLACDHRRPICTRCRRQRKPVRCVYRMFPFRRRQLASSPPQTEQAILQDSIVADISQDSPLDTLRNPSLTQRHSNPGHLGFSSHVTIFNEIAPSADTESVGLFVGALATSSLEATAGPSDSSPLVRQAALTLQQLVGTYTLDSMESLISFWNARGVNLALAEPFVGLCSQASNYSGLLSSPDEAGYLKLMTRLVENSRQPLIFMADTEFSEFESQFSGSNTRLETLAIFLCAVIRATVDIPFFPSLYSTDTQKREFRAMLPQLIECLLDMCHSLDCLNDLQHIVQYEYCIIHSAIFGGHSYQLWRRLGDVISSTLGLGYHEDSGIGGPNTPRYLLEIRRTAISRVYSADKNISLFLGRPPRLSKRFCHFQLPDSQLPLNVVSCNVGERLEDDHWQISSKMNYRAETRWSGLCAFIKEDIMEILFNRHSLDCRQKVSVLQALADKQWDALPAHFRDSGKVKELKGGPFQRDFVVSVRLNFLHITFLLQRLLLDNLLEPNETLIKTATEMLDLVVDAIILRDELCNSGTTLLWKVAQYGLPAAGMLLLTILRPNASLTRFSRARAFQVLTLFAAEMERGSLVKPGDANYVLLSKASRILQHFMDPANGAERLDEMVLTPQAHERVQLQEQSIWAEQWGLDPLGSEFSFWQGLADHPSLYINDPTLNVQLQSP